MITLKNIILFLEKSGWEAHPTNKAGIILYSEPEERNPAEIFLPNNENDRLFKQYINEAINILSFVQEVDPILISNAISKLDKDLINYRITENNSDSIAISFLEDLIQSSKNSLKSASKIEYSEYYGGLEKTGKDKHLTPTDHLNYYLNNLTFAHTWKGSFGITIESPLEVDSLGLFKLDDSVGRKTTKRVLKGYQVINEATLANSSDYILDHIESKEDVNVLSPYLSLIENIKKKQIDVSFNFSPIIDIEDKESIEKPLKINKQSLWLLDKAISNIIDEAKEFDIEFVGFPEVMRSSMEGLKEEDVLFDDRIVTVKGTSRQTGNASLRMVLGLEDYRKALKAQEEIKNVLVRCRVKRRQKGWEVLSVDTFELIK